MIAKCYSGQALRHQAKSIKSKLQCLYGVQCCSLDFLVGHTMILLHRYSACARSWVYYKSKCLVYYKVYLSPKLQIIVRHGNNCTCQLFFLPKMAYNFNGNMATTHSARCFLFSPPHVLNERMTRQIRKSTYIILRTTPYPVNYITGYRDFIKTVVGG